MAAPLNVTQTSVEVRTTGITHSLYIEEWPVGEYVGICDECSDTDWEEDGYVTRGQYHGPTEADVRDAFLDNHN